MKKLQTFSFHEKTPSNKKKKETNNRQLGEQQYIIQLRTICLLITTTLLRGSRGDRLKKLPMFLQNKSKKKKNQKKKKKGRVYRQITKWSIHPTSYTCLVTTVLLWDSRGLPVLTQFGDQKNRFSITSTLLLERISSKVYHFVQNVMCSFHAKFGVMHSLCKQKTAEFYSTTMNCMINSKTKKIERSDRKVGYREETEV